MEFLWACLLIMALSDRQARPLVYLTAAVAVLCYASYGLALYRLPVAIDLIGGVLLAKEVGRLPTIRMRVFSACLVLIMLVHAWHWLLWDAGNANDAVRFAYYTLLALLFSVKVLSLSWPGVQSLVGIVADGLGRAGGWLLDRLAPVPRSRPRSSRW